MEQNQFNNSNKFVQKLKLSDNFEITYIDNQKSDKPTILLIHGWPDSMLSYQLLFASLMENYRVISPSLRSFGQSNSYKGELSISRFTEDIKEILDSQNIKQVFVIGHSMGSQIAHLLASKYPEYVKKLILIGTGKNFSNTETANVIKEVKEDLLKMDCEIMPKDYVDEFQGSTVTKDKVPKWFYDQILDQSQMANRQQWISGCDAMLNDDHSDMLKNITAEKTLLVRGEKDELCPYSQYEELLKLIKNSEYLEIKGGNHSPVWDYSEETAKIILQFIQ